MSEGRGVAGRLAALGGTPACTVQWPAWPEADERDVAAVAEAVRSGRWGLCPAPNPLSRFAERFAEAHQAAYALPCCNGTVAIMIALRAAGVLPGDEVIVPAYTFMATATAVLGVGAVPVVADVEPSTLNLDPEKIGPAAGPRTTAVLPVHLAGLPADMDRIRAAAGARGLVTVEDAAQAHLAEYGGRRVGALGRAGAFSFQSSKNLSAGEGGVVTTDDREVYRVAHAFHHCGRDPLGGGWYEHPYMGQNFRMTQLQAALLESRLARLPAEHARRAANGRRLAERLSAVPGIRVVGWPWPEKVTAHAYHLFIFLIDPEAFGGVTNRTVCAALRAEGVPCHGGYERSLQDHDLFDDPYVDRLLGDAKPDYRAFHTPVARHAVEHCVWFKQNLLLADPGAVDRIAEAVEKVRAHAADLPRLEEGDRG